MRLLLTCACMFLAGCASLVPPVDDKTIDRTTAAYETLSEVLARAELGQFVEPATHAQTVEKYVTILSQIETAGFEVGSTRASGSAQEAREALSGLISACVAQVRAMSDLHRDFGLKPETGSTQPVRVTCDAATRALAAAR